jgi:hypothetical protein
MPWDDWTTFRSSCRELLDAEDFAAADDIYVIHARDAHRALTKARAPEAAYRLARRYVTQSPSLAHSICCLRALQAAAFASGIRLRVDIDQLRPDDLQPDGNALKAARANPSPRFAALLTCVGNSQPIPQALRRTVGQTERARASAPALVAQGMNRRLTGADDDAPLFDQVNGATQHHEVPWTVKAAHRALRVIGHETGHRFLGVWNSQREESDRQWARRRGITAELLND